MKSTEQRLQAHDALLMAIASKLGIEVETPKTTARVSRTRETTPMVSRKPSARTTTGKGRLEDIVIEEVGTHREDGRMRLPKRMFAGHGSLTVDGVEFNSLDSDQGRSANFNPAVIGAEVGDTCVFSHVGGTKWTVDIEGGTRKRKAAPKAAQTNKGRYHASKTPDRPKVAAKRKGRKSTMSLDEAVKHFGNLARENAGSRKPVINTNIKNVNDPRKFLNSRENAQAKHVWRNTLGISQSEWIALLDAEVYE